MSEEGHKFLSSPTSVDLPRISEEGSSYENSTEAKSSKLNRESKRSQAVPIIRTLLSQSENWFEITTPSEYQYPGVFSQQEYPQRVAFCPDVTHHSHSYDETNNHFLFKDIQLEKGTVVVCAGSTSRLMERANKCATK